LTHNNNKIKVAKSAESWDGTGSEIDFCATMLAVDKGITLMWKMSVPLMHDL
jgi:hypothetical protein